MRAPVAAALVATLLGPQLAAQRAGEVRQGWADQYTPQYGEMSAAERARVAATLAAIERIFWRVPELARPDGFEVLKTMTGTKIDGPVRTIVHEFVLWFFVPNKKLSGDGSQGRIEVWVNWPNGNRRGSNRTDAEGHEMFLDRDVGTPIPGTTIVHERLDPVGEIELYVTLSKGGASPWKAATREQVLRAMMFQAEGAAGDKETGARKSLEKTPYEQWLEGAAERKKNIDEAVAAVAPTQGKAAADEFRQSLEKMNRDVGEGLKANDAEARKQRQALLATPTLGAKLRAQLAAMTPAERASPAWVTFDGALVAADDPAGHRVMTADPAFWRVRSSAAEVHAITVVFRGGVDSKLQKSVYESIQKLDWAALKRLVEADTP